VQGNLQGISSPKKKEKKEISTPPRLRKFGRHLKILKKRLEEVAKLKKQKWE
jgi:hypothetical protein